MKDGESDVERQISIQGTIECFLKLTTRGKCTKTGYQDKRGKLVIRPKGASINNKKGQWDVRLKGTKCLSEYILETLSSSETYYPKFKLFCQQGIVYNRPFFYVLQFTGWRRLLCHFVHSQLRSFQNTS